MLNGPVSHRHLPAASAAALASTAAVTTPSVLAQAATPSPDAEPLAMAQEWIQGHERLSDLFEAQNQAEGRYHEVSPQIPDETIVRDSDLAQEEAYHTGPYWCPEGSGQRRYTEVAIREFRSAPRMMNVYSFDRPGETWLQAPEPEAQARADEIVGPVSGAPEDYSGA